MSIENYGKIQHVRFWCQKVLPLVYDDSLSYYEVLCKVVSQLNTFIDDYNEFVSEFPNEVQEAVEEEVSRYISQLIGNYNAFPLNNLQKYMRQGYERQFRILCCGTSITWGQDGSIRASDNPQQVAAANRYPNVLQSNLNNWFNFGETVDDTTSDFLVLTMAESGSTSEEINAAAYKARVLELEPDLIILEMGASDARRGIPAAETQGYILQFANWCVEHNIDICYLGCMPVFDSTWNTAEGRYRPVNNAINTRNGRGRMAFNDNMRSFCESIGMHFIDAFSFMNAAYQDGRLQWSEFQPDGAHLTNYAYLAYCVSDQLFHTAIKCEGKGLQFQPIVPSSQRKYVFTSVDADRKVNFAYSTNSAFGAAVRIANGGEFYFRTCGERYFRTGVVLQCNSNGGLVRFAFNGAVYTFNTYLPGVTFQNSVEKIFWFNKDKALFNAITFRDVNQDSANDQETTPYCYLTAVVVEELNEIPVGLNITEAS